MIDTLQDQDPVPPVRRMAAVESRQPGNYGGENSGQARSDGKKEDQLSPVTKIM
jgi:hypothetical protein